MKTLAALFLACGLLSWAQAPTPRPAGAFTIHELPGKDTTLASLKGKVVVVQFLSTECPHCQNTAKWLSKMAADMKAKGVAVYGVAFNQSVNQSDAAKNLAEVKKFGAFATFPVGVSAPDPVMKFLGLSMMQNWYIPQIVVIDKKGVVQAQTELSPSEKSVANEAVMRATVTKLLGAK